MQWWCILKNKIVSVFNIKFANSKASYDIQNNVLVALVVVSTDLIYFRHGRAKQSKDMYGEYRTSW